MSERVEQHAIRLRLGQDPRCVLFRNNVGVADQRGARVAYGVGGPGGSDLLGMLRGSGRFVALEVKSETGRLRPEQTQFLQIVRASGGFGAVVRSADEAVAAIDRACAGAVE